MRKTTVSVRGKPCLVPELEIEGAPILVTGGFIKSAVVKDEDYFEGEAVKNPARFIAELKAQKSGADVFSFSQRLPNVEPKHAYPMHWDNAAAIPIATYDSWWGSLSQETRRNVRLASKKGLQTSAVPFNDNLVRGIAGIYNETPIRQGRRFWHYGKGFEEVKRDNGTFEGRSEFIGTFLGSTLIGFIKMVYVDNIASVMQILSMAAHQDKRPTNALLAKAVEICAAKGKSHLVYCKYVYHTEDALTEFKRRNGFAKILYPRYFIPLTLKGSVFVRSGAHLGIDGVLPNKLVKILLNLRTRYYNISAASHSAQPKPGISKVPVSAEGGRSTCS